MQAETNGVQRGINYVYHLINKRNKSNDISYFLFKVVKKFQEKERQLYIYIYN